MKVLFTSALFLTLSASAYSQDIGGLLGRAANAVGGKADCVATYKVSKAGVFGANARTETKNVRGRSIQAACEKAKKENDSDSGVFGNSTKYLSSLTCVIKRGISVDVDVYNCEARL